MKGLAVHTTVADADQARTLARAVVERRLAACVQVEPITSHFIWQGALREETEYRLVCKTSPQRVEALVQTLREMHPYDVPELSTTAVEWVDADYAQWVAHMCEH